MRSQVSCRDTLHGSPVYCVADYTFSYKKSIHILTRSVFPRIGRLKLPELAGVDQLFFKWSTWSPDFWTRNYNQLPLNAFNNIVNSPASVIPSSLRYGCVKLPQSLLLQCSVLRCRLVEVQILPHHSNLHEVQLPPATRERDNCGQGSGTQRTVHSILYVLGWGKQSVNTWITKLTTVQQI
jgi:hypothetical protein